MATNENYRLPTQQTLEHATKIAVVEDKPIMLIIGPFLSTKKFLLECEMMVKSF